MVHTLRTTCNRDCPDGCGIIAHVESGRIVRIRGDKNHPVTQGFLCRRTSRFLQTQYSAARVTQPLLRQAGKLKPVTWDKALDFIAEKFRNFIDEEGAQSIFHYRSGGNLGQMLSVADLFWKALGPVTTKRGDICTGALDAAQLADFSATDANDFFDVKHAKHLLIWGRNLHACSPHGYSYVKKEIEKGLMCTVIDPMPTKTSELAQRWIQPRPGGDFSLVMAVAQVFLQEKRFHPSLAEYADYVDEFVKLVQSHSLQEWTAQAGVSLDDVEHIAAAFDAADEQGNIKNPLTTLIGWGMGRRSNGATLIRAIDALHVVTGHIGIQGAGPSYYFNRKASLRKASDLVDLSLLQVPDVEGSDDVKLEQRTARTFAEPMLADELANAQPKARGMWVTAGNPVAMLPDSDKVQAALSKLDLLVVVDWWLSDTAKVADVVLPCATLLERNDVLGAYGHHYLSRAQEVVPPLGESKTDIAILQALAPKLGLENKLRKVGFFDDDNTWLKRLCEPALQAVGDGDKFFALLKEQAVRSPLAPRVAFSGRVFPTENGKAKLMTSYEASGHFAFSDDSGNEKSKSTRKGEQKSLFLFAVSSPNSQSSQQIDPAAPLTTLEARVHPDVQTEGRFWLCSTQGRIIVEVKHVPKLHRQIVHLDKGTPDERGVPINALLKAQLTDHGEGGALYEEQVWFEPFDAAN